MSYIKKPDLSHRVSFNSLGILCLLHVTLIGYLQKRPDTWALQSNQGRYLCRILGIKKTPLNLVKGVLTMQNAERSSLLANGTHV